MLGHKTFTGQGETVRRNAIFCSASIQNDLITLRDVFKCVLNVILRIFVSFDCELMHLQCRFCSVRHFKSKVTLNERTALISYFHKGKAIFSALSKNE